MLLGLYREAWSPDDADARRVAHELIAPKLPGTRCLMRALDHGAPFVHGDTLVAEWGA